MNTPILTLQEYAGITLDQGSWIYHKLLYSDACGSHSTPIYIRFTDYKSLNLVIMVCEKLRFSVLSTEGGGTELAVELSYGTMRLTFTCVEQ